MGLACLSLFGVGFMNFLAFLDYEFDCERGSESGLLSLLGMIEFGMNGFAW
jgi:hypothetical protein